MINQELPRERTHLQPTVVGVAAAMLLTLAVLVVVAIAIYRAEYMMMAAPSTSFAFAGVDYLAPLHELSALVSPMKDGALPTPSL